MNKTVVASICPVCAGAILAPEAVDLHCERVHPDEEQFAKVLAEAIDGHYEVLWEDIGSERRNDYRAGATAVWKDIVRAVAKRRSATAYKAEQQ